MLDLATCTTGHRANAALHQPSADTTGDAGFSPPPPFSFNSAAVCGWKTTTKQNIEKQTRLGVATWQPLRLCWQQFVCALHPTALVRWLLIFSRQPSKMTCCVCISVSALSIGAVHSRADCPWFRVYVVACASWCAFVLTTLNVGIAPNSSCRLTSDMTWCCLHQCISSCDWHRALSWCSAALALWPVVQVARSSNYKTWLIHSSVLILD